MLMIIIIIIIIIFHAGVSQIIPKFILQTLLNTYPCINFMNKGNYMFDATHNKPYD